MTISTHKRRTAKTLIAVFAGLLCFFLSPYGIDIKLDTITISLPWSILFPVIVSLAYGWQYAIISGISGGALFPFYIWFNNGYPDVTTSIIYLIFYVLLGLTIHSKASRISKIHTIRLLIVYSSIIFIFFFYYKLLFNYLLSLNPPFWTHDTISDLSPEILNGFFIKDSINFLAFIIISVTLLKINPVRKFLMLKTDKYSENNTLLLLYSIVVAFLVWFAYYLLSNSLLIGDNEFHRRHLTLSFLVIFTSSLIVARILMYFNKLQLESKSKLKETKKKLTVKYKELKYSEQRLRNANEELIVAKEKAEENDRLKTKFISNMSHEIRTPMNGIMGFSELLTNDSLSKNKQKQYIKIIQNSGYQLLKIIDDILEISRLETKQVQAMEAKICLNDLMFELFSIFSIKAKENKTPLYLKKGASDTKSTIYTDDSKLNKIISNLIENAIKFTNVGFIEFGYHITDTESNPSVDIYVKDTGYGVDSEMQQLIFERFSQAEKEISQKTGGLGLGLSIAKENTELLGGKIYVESTKGEGSTFFVSIPYKPVSGTDDLESESKSTEEDERNCILVVEDEEVNYLYLEAQIETIFAHNCHILHARNGKEAIELFNQNSDIDLIFMDLKMPVMNGFDAAKQIRQQNANIIIVAQTAYTSDNDKEKALQSGCNNFITKPINSAALYEIIEKYMPGKLNT